MKLLKIALGFCILSSDFLSVLRYLERGAVVKAPSSFKLSSSISEAQRDTLTRIQFKTAAYLRRLAQPLRCFV